MDFDDIFYYMLLLVVATAVAFAFGLLVVAAINTVLAPFTTTALPYTWQTILSVGGLIALIKLDFNDYI